MIPEEQMPHPPPMLPNDKELVLKFLGAIIIVTYLIYLSTIAVISSTFIPQMEEAGEETAELISTGEGGAGGAVQVINNDMAQEVRAAFIISLVSFGILDGVFALMLWRRRIKRGHETPLVLLTTIQIINRPLSAFLMVQFSISVFVNPNPRVFMNALYLVVLISSVVSLVLALIVYDKLLESKTQRIAYKIREKTPV